MRETPRSPAKSNIRIAERNDGKFQVKFESRLLNYTLDYINTCQRKIIESRGSTIYHPQNPIYNLKNNKYVKK